MSNINAAEQAAQIFDAQPGGNLLKIKWYYDNVRTGGPMDYKNQPTFKAHEEWRSALGSATDQCWISVHVCVSRGRLLVPPSGAAIPVRAILRVLCSTGLFFLLVGCSNLRDSDIASRLASERSTFERLAKMAEEKPLSCFAEPDHALKCDDPEALRLFERLNKRDGLRSVHTKMNVPRVTSGVYFAMVIYGPITTNSQSKGLLYATTTPSPEVSDTDQNEDVPRRFNSLYGNWYVFATP